MNKQTFNWITFLRAIACICVVMIHVIDGCNSINPIPEYSCRFIFDEVILQIFIQWAVPVFIMISGALLLNPNKEITMKKIFKYILRMLLILVTFGLMYCFLENIVSIKDGNIVEIIIKSITNLLQGKSWGVMWYIYMLIGLYAITPILRAFIKDTKDEELKIVIVLLFICSVIIPTINGIFNINITTFYLEEFKYITLYLLGYVLAYKKLFKEKTLYILGGVSMVIYLLFCYFNIFHYKFDMFMIFISMAIFLHFSNHLNNIRINLIIEKISKNSFGIYIIHDFWVNVLYKIFHFYPSNFPVVIGEFMLLFIVFVLAYISIEIIKRIPLINKIIS